MHGIDLHWLPDNPRWAEQLAAVVPSTDNSAAAWSTVVALARGRVSAMQTMQLDRRRAKALPNPPKELVTKPVRLAILGASTVDHLAPGIRVGGLRRSIWIDTYTPDYGQYTQELINPASGLHSFAPNAVLFALDAYHLMQGIELTATTEAVSSTLDGILDRLETQWATARRIFSAQILQNIPLPVFLPLLGSNEHRLAGSRFAALRQFGSLLRARADAAGVDLIALDDRAAMDGLAAWHDPALWHRAKQEIHPQVTALYGDLVSRLLAADQGRSSKCLVLDLDNTLWGGVIGDDGLAGIKLGQGSARGEAHFAFQQYARDLGRRGIILAVCSKNDEANALEPFIHHPEMVLKRGDIACFVANWTDKAANLREIATRLNIGLDSLVFADDNPAERAVVRRELPMVEVPELPEDPTGYAKCIADAGFFEAIRLTTEDSQRTQLYQQNVARESLMVTATDMDGYLRSLKMIAIWSRFDLVGQPRIVQLINKTNQFNLTTRRVTDDEVGNLVSDAAALTLQIRLLDQFGDNGIIAIVAGVPTPSSQTINLQIWLMSCRVLGRGMEEETLNLIVAEARRLGATRLTGDHIPSAKNGMVRDHYNKLGFSLVTEQPDGTTTWALDLNSFVPRQTFISSQPPPNLNPTQSADTRE